MSDVTKILSDLTDGDPSAVDRLFPLVYQELRRVAGGQLAREQPGHTLSPTALVHEAYFKLVDQAQASWQNRAHFFGIAARAMRQVLVDHARRRKADKRGGTRHRTTLSGLADQPDVGLEDLLALDAALDRLEQKDSRLRQLVEYRFFAGMPEKEVAEVLGVTTRTIQRDWVKARAWLHKELYQDTA